MTTASPSNVSDIPTDPKDWATIEGSIHIDAPHPTVRAIILDLSRYPDIYPGVDEVESDGTYPAVGAIIHYKYKAGVVNLVMESTTVELSDTHSVSATLQTSQQLTSKRVLRGRNTLRFEPHEGGTLLTLRYEYEMPGSAVGKLMEQKLTRGLIERNVQTSLQRVKALAEARG